MDGFAGYAATAWHGGGIGRNFRSNHTGCALGKVAVAVLAQWALLKYTRPVG